MSVEEHRDQAKGLQAIVQVIVVSSSRTEASDESGLLITELLEESGAEVLARHVVSDDVTAIRSKLGEVAVHGETNVVILTGGTGISRTDCTADAIAPLLDPALPGFGEMFRWLSYQEIGAAAMMSRASAGVMGSMLVFSIPGSIRACRLAMERLIVPEVRHLLRELTKDGPPLDGLDIDAIDLDDIDLGGDEDVTDDSTFGFASVEDVAQDETPEDETPDAEFEDVEEEADTLAAPSGTLGKLGQNAFQLASSQVVSEEPEEDDTVPGSGWKRAVYEVEGEVISGKREELPWDLEKISPVVDVLHTAGQVAVLELPSGIKYSLYGWPDLQRPTSKVVAIGWGLPIAEVLALHRYPTMTGLCIEEERGLMPNRNESVEAVCEQITGRAPNDISGKLFAISGDTVWIERGKRIIRWDGSREFDDGNRTQVLATLMLHWSNR